MSFTPKSVHENATPDTNELLVSGVDENGVPRNVTLRKAAELRARLVATPPTIVNPARAGVEQVAFDAAIAQVADEDHAIAEAEKVARAAAQS